MFPGASEYNLLSRICETLGPPPPSMLLRASHAHKLFKRTDPAGIQAAAAAAATAGAAAAAGGGGGAGAGAGPGMAAAAAGGHAGGGAAAFSLLSLEEYEARSGKKVAVGKRYFKHTRLADIVSSAGFASGLGADGVARERGERAALLDFLLGLLDTDPATRWTPDQARAHPFVKGEAFTRPFQPPPREEVGAAAGRGEQAAREQAAARAAAAVAKQAAGNAAAVVAQQAGAYTRSHLRST